MVQKPGAGGAERDEEDAAIKIEAAVRKYQSRRLSRKIVDDKKAWLAKVTHPHELQEQQKGQFRGWTKKWDCAGCATSSNSKNVAKVWVCKESCDFYLCTTCKGLVESGMKDVDNDGAKREQAARKIQAYQRHRVQRIRTKDDKRKRDEAALRIQAAQRGKAGKRDIEKLRREKEARQAAKAAGYQSLGFEDTYLNEDYEAADVTLLAAHNQGPDVHFQLSAPVGDGDYAFALQALGPSAPAPKAKTAAQLKQEAAWRGELLRMSEEEVGRYRVQLQQSLRIIVDIKNKMYELDRSGNSYGAEAFIDNARSMLSEDALQFLHVASEMQAGAEEQVQLRRELKAWSKAQTQVDQSKRACTALRRQAQRAEAELVELHLAESEQTSKSGKIVKAAGAPVDGGSGDAMKGVVKSFTEVLTPLLPTLKEVPSEDRTEAQIRTIHWLNDWELACRLDDFGDHEPRRARQSRRATSMHRLASAGSDLPSQAKTTPKADAKAKAEPPKVASAKPAPAAAKPPAAVAAKPPAAPAGKPAAKPAAAAPPGKKK